MHILKVFFAIIVYILALQAPGVAAREEKFLYVHNFDSMGWGNKMDWYLTWFWIAKQLDRTWVLPPFFNADMDYSELEHLNVHDLLNMEKAELTSFMWEKQNELIRDRKKTISFYPVTSWFEKEELEKYHKVIEMDDFMERFGGKLDTVIVPGQSHGCLPSYESECKETRGNRPNTKSNGKDNRFKLSEDISWDRMVCARPDFEGRVPTVIHDKEELLQVFDQFADDVALGVDGACYSSFVSTQNLVREAREDNREYWKFTRELKDIVKNYRKENNLRRFISVHWRRGDQDLAHTGTSLVGRRPEAFARRVWKHLGATCMNRLKDSDSHDWTTGGNVARCEYDGIFLATDCFLQDDIKAFEDLMPIPVYRYKESDPITNIAVDLLMLAQGEWFVNSPGSSFSRWVTQERKFPEYQEARVAAFARDHDFTEHH